MRISDWSSDVCSSDLLQSIYLLILQDRNDSLDANEFSDVQEAQALEFNEVRNTCLRLLDGSLGKVEIRDFIQLEGVTRIVARSEEHTSELQSLMRISYAVFCLKKKKRKDAKYKHIRYTN